MKSTTRFVTILILLLAAGPLRGASIARTVLVFPFANKSTRADLGWISEGFATMLSSRLEASNRYVLGREERNAAYAQLELAPGTPLTLASIYKVADILRTDWAVFGSFNLDGQRLTGEAQLLDLRSLKLSPPIEASGELADLVDLQTQLAWRLLAAHDHNFTTGSEDEFRRRFPEVRLDAFENYIRGILATDEASRVRFLTEADRRNPQDHQAAFLLGRYYFDQKDYAESMTWLRKLDEKDANFPEALFLLGVSEFFLGHDAVAEQAFAALSKQIPLNEVSNNLGVLEARRNSYVEALSSFERAYQGDVTDPDFAYNMGVSLWYLKRYNEAAKYLSEAANLDSEDIGAHSLLAAALGELGDLPGQRRELQWIAAHEGAATTSVAQQDSGQQDVGQQDTLPQARIKKHYDGRAFRLVALAIRNAEEVSLAGKPPAEHAAAHILIGKNLLAEGRVAEADRELAEAVSLVPNDSEAHVTLAQVLEAEGKNSEAAAELETALKLKDSLTAHLLLARVYLSLGRLDAARDQAQAARNLDPASQEAQRMIEQARERAQASRSTP